MLSNVYEGFRQHIENSFDERKAMKTMTKPFWPFVRKEKTMTKNNMPLFKSDNNKDEDELSKENIKKNRMQNFCYEIHKY